MQFSGRFSHRRQPARATRTPAYMTPLRLALARAGNKPHMHDELLSHNSHLAGSGRAAPARPHLVLLAVALSALTSAALCAGAILATAPPGVVPAIALICVGCPMFAAWEAPGALAAVRADRARRAGGKALARFRRRLDQLPETEHPLGL